MAMFLKGKKVDASHLPKRYFSISTEAFEDKN